ncbi:hypothetical protein MFLAVUS_005438 [Mucor flavus]|uniref:Uncharacterized protein n=1 Tax=Mucor flavus TaxID=439312 RepID=A0ABP9YYQ9_9FUNG
MTEYQNRTERRSLRRVELRKIRTEYKKSMNSFRSKNFDYNPKKFRKTFFYRQFKQSSKINAAVDSTATCEYKEEGTSLQTNTDMVSYNFECSSQAEDQVRLVSDCSDQATEGDALFEEGVQVSEPLLSDDIKHVVKSAHVADIAEEASSITERCNRYERRSLQRLASVITTEDTSVDTTKNDTSDISTGQINTVADSPVTSAHKEEGPSAQAITDMVVNNYECTSVVEGIDIAVDREGCDAEEVPSSGTDNFIIMADEEATIIVNNVYNTQDAESFKSEWSTLSLISEDMFDGSLDTLGKLQARTHANSEHIESGEEKPDNEDHLNEKEDEDKEEYERSLDIDYSFYEKYLKEVAWMVTPPSSIMSVICKEKTYLLVKAPQNITDVVSSKPVHVRSSIMGRVEEAAVVPAIQEATFSPVLGIKKKRLRALKEKAGTIVPKIKTVWKRLFN